MKRTMFIAAAVLVTLCCAFATSKSVDTESANDGSFLTSTKDLVTKSYDFKDFTGIQVGNGFEVTLVKSNKYSVVVEIESKYADDLKVYKDGNTVKVGVKNGLRVRNIMGTRKVTISMPSVNKINLSGASTLYCSDEFDCGMSRFILSINGASKVKSLSVNSVDGYFDLSGACSVNFKGSVSEAEIDLAGASKANFEIESSEVEVNVSGASKLTLVGKADELDADLSGASTLDAANFPADEVDVDCAGASFAEVDVYKKFEVLLTGASKCYYKSHNAVIVKQDVVGASTLKSK